MIIFDSLAGIIYEKEKSFDSTYIMKGVFGNLGHSCD
jgi:hypothetical protein